MGLSIPDCSPIRYAVPRETFTRCIIFLHVAIFQINEATAKMAPTQATTSVRLDKSIEIFTAPFCLDALVLAEGVREPR